MNWFSRFMLANWSYVFDALLLTMALLFGVHLGESRIQKAWDAEKLKIAQVEAKQEQHVEDVKHVQTQINQEITSGFLKKSKLLADRLPDPHAVGVCNIPTSGGWGMSTVSTAPAGAAPARSDPLLTPQGDARGVSCEQLSRDAVQTTLMLLEMQRWYQRQSAVDQ